MKLDVEPADNGKSTHVAAIETAEMDPFFSCVLCPKKEENVVADTAVTSVAVNVKVDETVKDV